jgi:hypothetical protein
LFSMELFHSFRFLFFSQLFLFATFQARLKISLKYATLKTFSSTALREKRPKTVIWKMLLKLQTSRKFSRSTFSYPWKFFILFLRQSSRRANLNFQPKNDARKFARKQMKS